jgi:iron complex transport system substrate-binding protein
LIGSREDAKARSGCERECVFAFAFAFGPLLSAVGLVQTVNEDAFSSRLRVINPAQAWEGQRGRQRRTSAYRDCGIRLHQDLGPGLLESVYELLLAAMISERGVIVHRQKPIHIEYRGLEFKDAFRIDILLENTLIIEIKSIEHCGPVHSKQLLTYLRLTRQPLGLLMNFGAATFREGLKRVVNQHTEFGSSRLRVHQASRSLDNS